MLPIVSLFVTFGLFCIIPFCFCPFHHDWVTEGAIRIVRRIKILKFRCAWIPTKPLLKLSSSRLMPHRRNGGFLFLTFFPLAIEAILGSQRFVWLKLEPQIEYGMPVLNTNPASLQFLKKRPLSSAQGRDRRDLTHGTRSLQSWLWR